MTETLVFAGVWLVAANVAAFVAFGLDKRRARDGGRRIPEKTLLMLALLGGSPGAKIAQRRFRHKTRKQPFRTLLNLIVVAQLLLVAVLLAGWRQGEALVALAL